MSSPDLAVDLGVHMRATYFSRGVRRQTVNVTPEQYLTRHTAAASPLPDHLEGVFKQLRLLVAYAELVPRAKRPALTAREREVLARVTLGESNSDIAVRLGLSPGTIRAVMAATRRKLQRDTDLLRQVTPEVTVASVHMASPLQVVLEIPGATWLALGFGLVALTERIATMPVRIERKRKDELLKVAITQEETVRLNHRADVLAELLVREASQVPNSTPDEVVFTAPDDLDDNVS